LPLALGQIGRRCCRTCSASFVVVNMSDVDPYEPLSRKPPPPPGRPASVRAEPPAEADWRPPPPPGLSPARASRRMDARALKSVIDDAPMETGRRKRLRMIVVGVAVGASVICAIVGLSTRSTYQLHRCCCCWVVAVVLLLCTHGGNFGLAWAHSGSSCQVDIEFGVFDLRQESGGVSQARVVRLCVCFARV